MVSKPYEDMLFEIQNRMQPWPRNIQNLLTFFNCVSRVISLHTRKPELHVAGYTRNRLPQHDTKASSMKYPGTS